jgi:hypothetical protein
MEYKFIELLTVHFSGGSDEYVRQNIAFRFNAVKNKMTLMQNRLQDIVGIIKMKNPSLLMQIQKTSNPDATASGGPTQAVATRAATSTNTKFFKQ